MTSLRKKIGNDFKDQIKKLETDREHLLHKVKEFETKYQKIIPEMEKLKATIQNKSKSKFNRPNFEKSRRSMNKVSPNFNKGFNKFRICTKFTPNKSKD